MEYCASPATSEREREIKIEGDPVAEELDLRFSREHRLQAEDQLSDGLREVRLGRAIEREREILGRVDPGEPTEP